MKPDTKVIVASGDGARESPACREEGAYDFYQKPVDIDTLGLIVQRAYRLHQIEAENRRLADKVGEDRTVLGSMITAAPEMAKVARTIERVAPTNVSVMLLGASGTGKELLARGVHDLSDRRDGPFMAINCAAILENLLESELFGHEKGASPVRSRPPRARSNWPGARCSSTKWATSRCPCRSSCCASCRSARSSASVVARRSASTRGSSVRPIRTSK